MSYFDYMIPTDPGDMESLSKYQHRLPYSSTTPKQRRDARDQFSWIIDRIPKRMGDVLIEVTYSCDSREQIAAKWGITSQAVGKRYLVAKDAARLVVWYGEDWPHPDEIYDIIRSEPDIHPVNARWSPDGREPRAVARTVELYLREWQMAGLQDGGKILDTSTVRDRINKWQRRWHGRPLEIIVDAVRNWRIPQNSHSIGLWERELRRYP